MNGVGGWVGGWGEGCRWYCEGSCHAVVTASRARELHTYDCMHLLRILGLRGGYGTRLCLFL
jgi:hypothetical protein